MNELHLAMVTSLAFNTVPAIHDRVLVPCLLFEAGHYPDRGVTITEEDLDGVMARFQAAKAPVPVRTEHLETPLDPLGQVVALHREGKFLFGTLAFPSGLYSHIVERKANRVSVAFYVVEDERGKGYQLKEASLVFSPRVPGAGFLTGEAVQSRLQQYRQAGKLTPAMEGPLSRLLSFGSLAFSDGGGAAELFAEVDALMNSLPVVQARGASVPAAIPGTQRPNEPGLPPEMARWARAMGLDPARVAQVGNWCSELPEKGTVQ